MMTKIKISYSGSLAAFSPVLGSYQKFGQYRNYLNNDPRYRTSYYLLFAIRHLLNSRPDLENFISIHMLGQIEAGNSFFAKEMKLGNVIIEGYKSKIETQNHLRNSDILFLPLERGVKYKPFAIPGKLYEYMLIGKPILLIGDPLSECAEILYKSGLGICFPHEDIEGISSFLIKSIQDKMFLKSFKVNVDFLNSNFSGDVLTGKLAKMIREI